MSPPLQASVHQFRRFVHDGGFADLARHENVNAAVRMLDELASDDANALIAALNDDDLAAFAADVDASGDDGRRGLTPADKECLFAMLARDLDAAQLERMSRSFADGHDRDALHRLRAGIGCRWPGVDMPRSPRLDIIAALTDAGVAFHTRDQWNAEVVDASRMAVDGNYRGIALHHAGNSHSCAQPGTDQMRRIQQEHLDLGSGDIGYHFAIDCSGAVYEGRDIRFKGEHIKNGNTGVVGVVLLADLSAAGEDRAVHQDSLAWWETLLPHSDDLALRHDEPTPAQRQALDTLTRALREQFPIRHFGGHREWATIHDDARACPGSRGLDLAAAMRRDFGFGAPQ